MTPSKPGRAFQPCPAIAVAAICLSLTTTVADETKFALDAPAGWGGETIRLPPGFAKDMTLQGVEHIRFAPGMMNPKSDSFFSYAFAFEIQKGAALNEQMLKAEFLKYYRGLCTAVLGQRVPKLAPEKFTLKMVRVVPTTKSKDIRETMPKWSAVLRWNEPFSTNNIQTLNLQIQTWGDTNRNFVFACVSPQKTDAEIWKQLHKIRDDYLDARLPKE